MIRFAYFLVCAYILATTQPATAGLITQWNFNSPVSDANIATGTNNPNVGAGTISPVGGVTVSPFASGDVNGGSTDPNVGDDSAYQTTTYATQGTGNKTAGIQFNVSTIGFSNIVVSWDQRHSNTSSRYVQFQYSTDGTNFTDFGALFDGNAGDTWFNNRSVDLSSIAGLNNNANARFRIVAAFAPSTSAYAPSQSSSTYGTAGTWRFDMLTISGDAQATAVPAPPSVILALIGIASAFVSRRYFPRAS